MHIVLIVLAASFLLYVAGTTLYLTAASTRYKKLPALRETEKTQRGTSTQVKFCPNCGTDIAGSKFCPNCGTPAKATYTYRLPIQGSITAQKAEAMVNDFLAQNPYIKECSMKINHTGILMFPFVQLRFRVKYLELTYSLAQTPQAHRYGLAFVYKYRVFGLAGFSVKKMVARWAGNNPDSTVLSYSGSKIQHFSTRGNFSAHYHGFIFFRR